MGVDGVNWLANPPVQMKSVVVLYVSCVHARVYVYDRHRREHRDIWPGMSNGRVGWLNFRYERAIKTGVHGSEIEKK
jgi:hypothetical protein